ncbi:glycosyltransferase family 2 protein [Bacillus sp. JJ722]|uniref:glycosyltransferase family 2 protein n=1 Tax=Bacillus sp. JJ722 TaxID=3122973 RepID=UPI002FFFA3B9
MENKIINRESRIEEIKIKVNEYEPLVSVIIATFRRIDSLKKALVSLTTQTYQNIEIVVVDDNADKSWNEKVFEIITESDHPIIYIRNNLNQGSAMTRNIGIEVAKGEYITFLDDDDIYLPQKIEKQLVNMLKNDSDFSITDLCLYDENDNLIEIRNRFYLEDVNRISQRDSLEYSKQLLKYHLMYHMTGTDTMMYKKSYLISIGYFPLINVGDEFYLMQKAIQKGGRFSYVERCDIKAYVHSETLGLSSGDSKINGENRLYEHKKKFFTELSSKEKRYITMRHFAVLAFAEKRRKRKIKFLKYCIISFFNSPIQCSELLLSIMKR